MQPDISNNADGAGGVEPVTGHAVPGAGLVVVPRLAGGLSLADIGRGVRQMIWEVLVLTSGRVAERRDRRRLACHVRQISMYVCHVALRMPQVDIGQAFGRDRSTVGHACHVVEDRRDDPVFDEFVSALERMAVAVFAQRVSVVHD